MWITCALSSNLMCCHMQEILDKSCRAATEKLKTSLDPFETGLFVEKAASVL